MGIPFCERPTCTIAEACAASGLGRTKLYEAMADGRLAWTKVDNRRLIAVPSLLKMLAPAAQAGAPNQETPIRPQPLMLEPRAPSRRSTGS